MGIFRREGHILESICGKREGDWMYSTGGPEADLEDLLFDEDSGGPSER